MDAVGNCVSCGRPVCEECKVRMNNLVHCRECVESGRLKGGLAAPPMPFPPAPAQMPIIPLPMRFLPRPRGRPRPDLFRGGAIGAMLSGGLMFSMGVSVIFYIFSSSSTSSGGMTGPIFLASMIGFFVMAIGCYGIHWNYGTQSGLLGVIGMLIMGPILVDALFGYTGGSVGFPSSFLSMMFNGPMGILYGATGTILHLSIAYSRHFIPLWHRSRKVLMFARGTSMIGVGFLYTMILSFIGFILFGIALILFAIFFITAPLPDDPVYASLGAVPPGPGLPPPPMMPLVK